MRLHLLVFFLGEGGDAPCLEWTHNSVVAKGCFGPLMEWGLVRACYVSVSPLF